MKVAVLHSAAPFVRGATDLLADDLVVQLRAHGHVAQLYRTQLRAGTAQQIQESMLAAGLWRLDGADRVVALTFPAYLVPHGTKVLWRLPQTPPSQRGDVRAFDADWMALRKQIHQADHHALSGAHQIHCSSQASKDRLPSGHRLRATVLRPPLGDAAQLHCESYGNYLLAAGGIGERQRQWLAVAAMRFVTSDVRLVVAGEPARPEDLARLQTLVARHGLQDRVQLLPGRLTGPARGELYAHALGSVHTPLDEDSHDRVTVESYACDKPVVTTVDAGAVLELVSDQRTGRVVQPDPQRLAEAFDALRDDPESARRWGVAGRAVVDALDLTWDRVVAVLTA